MDLGAAAAGCPLGVRALSASCRSCYVQLHAWLSPVSLLRPIRGAQIV